MKDKMKKILRMILKRLWKTDNASGFAGGLEVILGLVLILMGMLTVAIGIYFYMIVTSGIFARMGNLGPNYFPPIIMGSIMIIVGVVFLNFGRKSMTYPGEREI